MAPLMPMYTLGADFIPAPIHAGGLRYHGDSALVSLLRKEDHIEAVAYPQSKVFEAAVQFARTEGILLLRARPRDPGRDRRGPALQGEGLGTIVFNLTAHFDLKAYEDHLSGNLSMSDPHRRRSAPPGRRPHRPDRLGHFGDWEGGSSPRC